MEGKENMKEKQKTGVLESESQNDSDKTKDTLFQVQQTSLFKHAYQYMTKLSFVLTQLFRNLTSICQGTAASDKLVRLAGSLIKLLKNFELITLLSKFDKFASQITQLRRLLRINRILMVLKDYVGFVKKANKKVRDFFDVFFKTVMLTCDIHDMLAYLMQLRVIQERGLATLKKNVANIYFCECILWCCVHIYDYFTKDKTESQINRRRVNIVKYLMDTTLSHNDFSMKKFSVGVKQSTVLGLVSSLIGIGLIWK